MKMKMKNSKQGLRITEVPDSYKREQNRTEQNRSQSVRYYVRTHSM